MKFVDKIDCYIKEKKRCFVNGMPESDTQGLIISREDDFIVFETTKIETEKKTQKEKTTKETIIIPIDKINDISEGETIKEINMLDKALKALDS